MGESHGLSLLSRLCVGCHIRETQAKAGVRLLGGALMDFARMHLLQARVQSAAGARCVNSGRDEVICVLCYGSVRWSSWRGHDGV